MVVSIEAVRRQEFPARFSLFLLVLGDGLYADFRPISSPHRLAHPQQDSQASTTPPNPAIDDPPHPHVATPATRRRSEPLADADAPAPLRGPEACSNLIAYQEAETGP